MRSARISLLFCIVALVAMLPAVPASAQQPRVGLGIAPNAPLAAIDQVLKALEAAGVPAEQVAGDADLQLVTPGADGSVAAWERVFTPAVRMSSLLDSIRLDELKGVWTGAARSSNFATLYVGKEAATVLAPLLGRPGPRVKIVPDDGVEAAVWGDRTGVGIVPFDRLTVRLRALKVNGQSPVDNRFRLDAWLLTARASLVGLTDRGRAALTTAQGKLPATNRDPAKLTVLVMTGVTAMARSSAAAIEKSGDYGFLARKVGPELAAADITTVSNEIPFAPGCMANNSPNTLVLCSKPEYWKNLELSGVDAIGLTGNHLLDFGRKALLGTLALYEEKKIPVYGGGANEKAAAEPVVLEHNGNRLGFLGANQYGPPVAWAGPDKPGSARFNLAKMQADIKALTQKADVVFAEVQHFETNYKGEYVNVPNDQAEIDFRGLSDAGADVVTGVMAHAPQAVEIRKGRLILYGLGNLYFDQTWSWPTRTGLVARHTIYDGELLNTELLVTVIDKNYQLRWASPAERKQVLGSIFAVSRW
ncbi:MAG: CapA family protein [Nitrososphaerales archaeon]